MFDRFLQDKNGSLRCINSPCCAKLGSRHLFLVFFSEFPMSLMAFQAKQS